jgi:hypothetical protein
MHPPAPPEIRRWNAHRSEVFQDASEPSHGICKSSRETVPAAADPPLLLPPVDLNFVALRELRLRNAPSAAVRFL